MALPVSAAFIAHESKFFSDVNQGGHRGPIESSGIGYSWAQWTGPRQTNMVSYCGKHHLPVGSDGCSLEFLVYEMNTTFRAALEGLRHAGSVEQATQIALNQYGGGASRRWTTV